MSLYLSTHLNDEPQDLFDRIEDLLLSLGYTLTEVSPPPPHEDYTSPTLLALYEVTPLSPHEDEEDDA